MPEAVNPLLPAGYDIAWSAVALVAFALLVVALVSVGRAKSLTPGQGLVWVLVSIFVPIVGPGSWLLVGRRLAKTASQPSRP